MWRLSSVITLVMVFSLVFAETERPMQNRYFLSNGKPFAKVAGKTREPKTVIDTVNVVSGQGVLLLNKEFNRERHSVRGTSNLNIFATATGILDSVSETVYSYSCYVSRLGDSVIVKSSGGSADTSKVAVQIVLK